MNDGYTADESMNNVHVTSDEDVVKIKLQIDTQGWVVEQQQQVIIHYVIMYCSISLVVFVAHLLLFSTTITNHWRMLIMKAKTRQNS